MRSSAVIGLLAVGLVVGACGPQKTCDQNEDCPSGAVCDPELKACVNTDVCSPACAESQQCINRACSARYKSITITRPTEGGGLSSNGRITATLDLIPGKTRSDPATLDYKVTKPDGSSVTGKLTKVGEGSYSAAYAPPDVGDYKVVVTYAAANLTSATVTFQKDDTAPTVSLVSAAPSRPAITNIAYDPALGLAAWRRDEVATIHVVGSSDLDTESVKVFVQGLAKPDGTLAPEQGPLTATAAACPSGSPAGSSCADVNVDIAAYEMKIFRGNFKLRVEAQDLAGNAAPSVTQNLPVTRWKWGFGATNAIKTSPAVGSTGNIYFGTYISSTSGTFFALKPDGTTVWSDTTVGSIVASPSVGTVKDSKERVYVGATNASGGRLYIFDGFLGGASLRECGTSLGPIEGSLALSTTTDGNGTDESAFAVDNTSTASGRLALIRSAELRTDGCTMRTTTGINKINYPGGLVANGNNVYYGDNQSKLQSYTYDNTGSWLARTGWPVALGLNPHSLFLFNGIVGGGGASGSSNGLYAVPEAGTSASWTAPYGSETWNPSLGPNKEVVVGTGDVQLARAAIAGASSTTTTADAPGGTVKGAPAWGQGGRLYVAADSGEFESRTTSASLPVEWKASGLGAVEASINLDCTRGADGKPVAGRPGVAYVASTGGSLYAFVVDSRGIDTTADWPKYQHDPRNTGNPATALSEFACP